MAEQAEQNHASHQKRCRDWPANKWFGNAHDSGASFQLAACCSATLKDAALTIWIPSLISPIFRAGLAVLPVQPPFAAAELSARHASRVEVCIDRPLRPDRQLSIRCRSKRRSLPFA